MAMLCPSCGNFVAFPNFGCNKCKEFKPLPGFEPDRCVCGHCKVAHEGHAHTIWSETPTYCSQGCGCLAYKCQEREE